jgi:hypothetical protein
MAAAAQEEARKLHQAKEAFERATAMAEGVTMKAWKTADKQRREAAVRAAEAKAVALKRASDELAATRAAPCYTASFFLPFRRHDVWKELALYEDPLDYPSSEWLAIQRSGNTFGALASGLGGASMAAPGLVRKLERRFGSRNDAITLELAELISPSLLRWRILSKDEGGALAPLRPRIVPEVYDDGAAATPGIDVVLDNAPYGTQVTLRVGTDARFELPPLCDCARSLVAEALSRSESHALSPKWCERLKLRGYKPLRPKHGEHGAGAASLLTPKGSPPRSARSPGSNTFGLVEVGSPPGRGGGGSDGGGGSSSSMALTLSSPEELRLFATNISPPGAKQRTPPGGLQTLVGAGSTTRPFLAAGASAEAKAVRVDIDRGFWAPAE